MLNHASEGNPNSKTLPVSARTTAGDKKSSRSGLSDGRPEISSPQKSRAPFTVPSTPCLSTNNSQFTPSKFPTSQPAPITDTLVVSHQTPKEIRLLRAPAGSTPNLISKHASSSGEVSHLSDCIWRQRDLIRFLLQRSNARDEMLEKLGDMMVLFKDLLDAMREDGSTLERHILNSKLGQSERHDGKSCIWQDHSIIVLNYIVVALYSSLLAPPFNNPNICSSLPFFHYVLNTTNYFKVTAEPRKVPKLVSPIETAWGKCRRNWDRQCIPRSGVQFFLLQAQPNVKPASTNPLNLCS